MKQYVKPETTSFQTTPSTTLCASVQVGVELGTMKVKSFDSSVWVIALMLSGMLLLPSCKNGNGDIQQPAPTFKKGEVVTITTDPFGAGNKTPRRVHIGTETPGTEGTSGEAQLFWTEGDQLRVIVPSGTTPFPSSDFVLTDGADTKLGTFTGTMPADGSEFFLAYPCGNVEGSSWDEQNRTFTFQGVKVPNVQNFEVGATTFYPGLMPVVGYGKDDNGTLTGTTTVLGGALRVKLTNNTGKEITFNKIQLDVHNALTEQGGDKTSVWGTYTVDYNVSSSHVATVTPSGTTAGNSNSVLNLSEKVTLTDNQTSDYFYFVMLAPLYFNTTTIGGITASFTVYLFDYDDEVTSTSDLSGKPAVATTSFTHNISIEPGEIVEGTLEMTASQQP